MDLSNPISAVVPGGRGLVLGVLARTERPLSGRRVAELVGDKLGKTRVLEILGELAETGMVLARSEPPAILYSLNRDHVAAEAIVALADLRERLVERIRTEVLLWDPAPVTAWLFGSAARGDGGLGSDVDVIVVRPDAVDAEDPAWAQQVLVIDDAITRWAGNESSVLEYSEAEVAALARTGDALLESIQREGIHLAGGRQLVRRVMGVR